MADCIDSVINQTLKEIEVICINDGSTDSSERILREYMGKDSRIRYVSQVNQGPGPSRNRGVTLAGGRYVAFMDSDDYYPESDVLEMLYGAADHYKKSIVGGQLSLLNPDGSIVDSEVYKDDPLFYGYHFYEEGVIDYKDYQFDYGYQRFIYDREFLISHGIGFPDLARFQDPPFFVRAMSLAGSFYALQKDTYRYRNKSKPVEWNKKRVSDLLAGLVLNLDFAQENNYQKLHDLTAMRMADEYRQQVAWMSHSSSFGETDVKGVGVAPRQSKGIKQFIQSRFPASRRFVERRLNEQDIKLDMILERIEK